MNVGEVCSRETYCIGPNEPLAEAARALLQRHVGALVVIGHRNESIVPVGIVTDRDIVCGQLARKADLFCLSVADVMTPDPLVLAETLDLSEAIRRLQCRSVRRAPVVNASGELIGIVSIDDLLPVMAHDLSGLASLLERQSLNERPL
jgi:CBS domain-containing protein